MSAAAKSVHRSPAAIGRGQGDQARKACDTYQDLELMSGYWGAAAPDEPVALADRRE